MHSGSHQPRLSAIRPIYHDICLFSSCMPFALRSYYKKPCQRSKTFAAPACTPSNVLTAQSHKPRTAIFCWERVHHIIPGPIEGFAGELPRIISDLCIHIAIAQSHIMAVNCILVYSLSLLVYQAVRTAEREEVKRYFAEISKPLKGPATHQQSADRDQFRSGVCQWFSSSR